MWLKRKIPFVFLALALIGLGIAGAYRTRAQLSKLTMFFKSSSVEDSEMSSGDFALTPDADGKKDSALGFVGRTKRYAVLQPRDPKVFRTCVFSPEEMLAFTDTMAEDRISEAVAILECSSKDLEKVGRTPFGTRSNAVSVEELKSCALQRLSQFGPFAKEAAPAVLRQIKEPNTSRLAGRTLIALGEIPGEELLRELPKLKPEMLEMIMRAAQTSNISQVDALAKGLLESKDPKIKTWILALLETQGSKISSSLAALIAAANGEFTAPVLTVLTRSFPDNHLVAAALREKLDSSEPMEYQAAVKVMERYVAPGALLSSLPRLVELSRQACADNLESILRAIGALGAGAEPVVKEITSSLVLSDKRCSFVPQNPLLRTDETLSPYATALRDAQDRVGGFQNSCQGPESAESARRLTWRNSIIKMGNASVTGLSHLLSSPEPQLRWYALGVIADSPDLTKLLEKQVQAAASDTFIWVRLQALLALKGVMSPAEFDALVMKSLDSPEAQVCRENGGLAAQFIRLGALALPWLRAQLEKEEMYSCSVAKELAALPVLPAEFEGFLIEESAKNSYLPLAKLCTSGELIRALGRLRPVSISAVEYLNDLLFDPTIPHCLNPELRNYAGLGLVAAAEESGLARDYLSRFLLGGDMNLSRPLMENFKRSCSPAMLAMFKDLSVRVPSNLKKKGGKAPLTPSLSEICPGEEGQAKESLSSSKDSLPLGSKGQNSKTGNKPKPRQDLPIHLVVSRGSPEDLRQLVEIKKDPNLNVRGDRCNTPLMLAVLAGDEEKTRFILNSGGLTELENIEGETPLFAAVRLGHQSLVQLLLQSGAKTNLRISFPRASAFVGQSPLSAASERGDWEVVNLLLAHGAHPDLGRSPLLARTALMMAYLAQRQDMVQKLLASGANPYLQDAKGYSLFHLEAFRGESELSKKLLKGGGNLPLRTCSGLSPDDILKADQKALAKVKADLEGN